MTKERMRYIAETVCAYADAHGYPRNRTVETVIDDLDFVNETGALEGVTYLYDFIDYDDGEIGALVDSVWDDNDVVKECKAARGLLYGDTH